MFNSDNINIILVEPRSSGNIGSVCRAMKTTGFSQLRLINPSEYLDEEAYSMALSGTDILESADTFSSLKEATSDSSLVIGLTRRKGKNRTLDNYFDNLIDKIAEISTTGKVCLVFGREDNGLTQTEIEDCNILAEIKTAGSSGSLNLSQAVMICCYEICKSTTAKSYKHIAQPLNQQELVSYMNKIKDALKSIGYFKYDEIDRTLSFLEKIFSRSTLKKSEAEALSKFFYRIKGLFEQSFTTYSIKRNPKLLKARIKGALKVIDILNPLVKQINQFNNSLNVFLDKQSIIDEISLLYLEEEQNDSVRCFWYLTMVEDEYVLTACDRLIETNADKLKIQKLKILYYNISYGSKYLEEVSKIIETESVITKLNSTDGYVLINNFEKNEIPLLCSLITYIITEKQYSKIKILKLLIEDDIIRFRMIILNILSQKPDPGFIDVLLFLKNNRNIRVKRHVNQILKNWYENNIISKNYVKPQRTWTKPPLKCFTNEDKNSNRYYVLFLSEIKYRVYTYVFFEIDLTEMTFNLIEGERRIKDYTNVNNIAQKYIKNYKLYQSNYEKGYNVIIEVIDNYKKLTEPPPSEWRKWKSFIKKIYVMYIKEDDFQ